MLCWQLNARKTNPMPTQLQNDEPYPTKRQPSPSESTAALAPSGASEKTAGKHPCSDPSPLPMPRKQPRPPCRSRAAPRPPPPACYTSRRPPPSMTSQTLSESTAGTTRTRSPTLILIPVSTRFRTRSRSCCEGCSPEWGSTSGRSRISRQFSRRGWSSQASCSGARTCSRPCRTRRARATTRAGPTAATCPRSVGGWATPQGWTGLRSVSRARPRTASPWKPPPPASRTGRGS